MVRLMVGGGRWGESSVVKGREGVVRGDVVLWLKSRSGWCFCCEGFEGGGFDRVNAVLECTKIRIEGAL